MDVACWANGGNPGGWNAFYSRSAASHCTVSEQSQWHTSPTSQNTVKESRQMGHYNSVIVHLALFAHSFQSEDKQLEVPATSEQKTHWRVMI